MFEPYYRSFNGKNFFCSSVHFKKRIANKEVKRLRKIGWRIRLVPVTYLRRKAWAIYARERW